MYVVCVVFVVVHERRKKKRTTRGRQRSRQNGTKNESSSRLFLPAGLIGKK